MKLLYIPSGYKRIYHYFDRSILETLSKISDLTIRSISFFKAVHSLRDIINTYKPDLMLTMVGHKFPVKSLELLRSNNVLTAIWLTEDPYYLDQTVKLIPYYDFIFTVDRAAMEHYRNLGFNHTFHLPLGTDPAIFTPKPVQNKYKSDICMVGYPYPNRIDLIKQLLRETSFQIVVIGNWWKTFTANEYNHPRLKWIKGWISPAQIAHYYSNAKVVLNPHRPHHIPHNQNETEVRSVSINNRTFDIASCNSFQLIDYKEDISTHFKEAHEIISYHNHEEFFSTLNDFINDDYKRNAIAERARQRVLNEHLFKHRLQQLIGEIRTSI